MKDSQKRKSIENTFSTIYRVYEETPKPHSSNTITKEINPKESQDYIEAQTYFESLAKDECNENSLYFEQLVIDQNNQIVFSELLASRSLNY